MDVVVESPPTIHQTKLDDDQEVQVQVIESTSSTTTTETTDPEKDGMVTIFSDPINYNIKHPLQSTWVMWYDNPGKKTSQASWADNLKKIAVFATVEDFWGVYNNILSASKLQSGSNYHMFRDGIDPKWEDHANAHGGKWIVNIPKLKKEQLDQFWLYCLLSCIGENFEQSDSELCGVVISLRKQQDKLALWTRNSNNENVCRKMGRQLKELLELPETEILGYQSHASSLKRNSSFNNHNLYEI